MAKIKKLKLGRERSAVMMWFDLLSTINTGNSFVRKEFFDFMNSYEVNTSGSLIWPSS